MAQPLEGEGQIGAVNFAPTFTWRIVEPRGVSPRSLRDAPPAVTPFIEGKLMGELEDVLASLDIPADDRGIVMPPRSHRALSNSALIASLLYRDTRLLPRAERAIVMSGELREAHDQDPDRYLYEKHHGIRIHGKPDFDRRTHIKVQIASHFDDSTDRLARALFGRSIHQVDATPQAERRRVRKANVYDIVDFEVVLPELEPVTEEDLYHASLANGLAEREDDMPLRDRQVLARTKLFMDPVQPTIDHAKSDTTTIIAGTPRPDRHTKRSVMLRQEDDRRHLRQAISSKARAVIKMVRASGEKIKIKKPVAKPQIKAWKHIGLEAAVLESDPKLEAQIETNIAFLHSSSAASRGEVRVYLASQQATNSARDHIPYISSPRRPIEHGHRSKMFGQFSRWLAP